LSPGYQIQGTAHAEGDHRQRVTMPVDPFVLFRMPECDKKNMRVRFGDVPKNLHIVHLVEPRSGWFEHRYVEFGVPRDEMICGD
jgi:hypothetical protein